ncbi:NAD(P)H-dependent oxidoreductase [Geodermatophilus nigrescens]|uniref:Predicted homoserine dehydrogenase, contains C-terminal SAF domain n=1 Tax=Geodermatophilus nigrescens TaxID=1070870 RepID=A0A1M5D5P0_9ACTN|nr:Gfo/Idh/MocA family oxidoreductase [Geodermatophilus nigrescens]SHF62393.1 Predicted homoserine dehydrogenase, contains C-terminal SAF domain [Geodermatophilus nigrescens]
MNPVVGGAVDTLLLQRQAEGRPVRMGLVGAGFMAKGLVNQVVNSTPGVQLTVVCNRTPAKAHAIVTEAGATPAAAESVADVARIAAAGDVAVTDDIALVTGSDAVDVVVDATGAVDFGAELALAAIAGGKHLVLLNAEVDATLGPLLVTKADAAGVVYSGADGDQPGVQANLIRFVRQIGLRPLVAGNIKGLQDPYRNPTTQEGFAKRWGQDPWMVTSFADGTKVSVEQALVANAFGLTVPKRGLYAMDHTGHVDELAQRYDVEELQALGGVVDYVVGAKPGPGVYVMGTHDDPKQRHYLELYKLGTGPLYSFYTPYHLCHFEVPTTVARVALLGDATIRPAGAPQVDVVTVAKTDLAAGTVLDRPGGYHYYGEAERADVTHADRLLPVGLAEGCRLLRDVAKDEVVGYADVELPQGRLVDRLRAEQDEMFFGSAAAASLAASPA